MTTQIRISETSINDILRMAPAAGAVLNRFGLDTCCGGSLPLAAAAREAGAPLDALLAELAGVLPASYPTTR